MSTHTPLPLGPALNADFPGVDAACRIYKFSSLVKSNITSFHENVHLADAGIFKIFDFRCVEGNLGNALSAPNSVVLTKTIAKKYFGNSGALGKTLELLIGDETVLCVVTGIIEDAPLESSVRPAILISFSNDHYLWNESMRTSRWFNVSAETYVLLKVGAQLKPIERNLASFLQHTIGNGYLRSGYNIHFQSLRSIHTDASLPEGIESIVNPKYFYILSTIGGLVLLLASVNFITLSIGNSSRRAIEIGVRKVLGAERRHLIWQFWGESFIIILISFFFGYLIAMLLLPTFNQLIERHLKLSFDFTIACFSILLILSTAVIAGIYPALILSNFKPVEVLKGRIKLHVSPGIFRKGLTAAQFVAAIALISCAITVRRQLNYLQAADIGYNNKQHLVIVSTNLNSNDGSKLGEVYKSELLKLPDVAGVTVSTFSFAEPSWASIGYTDSKQINRKFRFNAADPDFLNTMGIQLKEGRNFSTNNHSDYTSSILVNETLVREYGLHNPIGKKLSENLGQQIIGVMKDFHTESLHKKIEPVVIAVQPDSVFRKADQEMFSFEPQPRVTIRLLPGNLSKQTAELKKSWQLIAPGQGFEFHFLDESLERQYNQDRKMSQVINIATFLSILIASMGLFGIVTLTVARRIKEIGIRKVLGANGLEITHLLTMNLLKLITIASIIAVPISWFALNKWLQDFAYRVNVNWWDFLLSGISAILIALITISFQVIKAARANPVKSLRME